MDDYPGDAAPTGARSGSRLRAFLWVLVIVLVVLGFVYGLFSFIMGSFKSSPVYKKAMEVAQADPQVQAALGTPIDAGWFITGSLREQGISGDANLTIPVHGPKGGGTLYAAAREQNGVWVFYTLAVQVDGQDQLIVLGQ